MADIRVGHAGSYIEALEIGLRIYHIGTYIEIQQSLPINEPLVSDDVQEADDGTGYAPSGTYVLIESSSTDSVRKNAAFRFTNVEVPNSANIIAAFISLTATDATDDDLSSTVYGEAVDNSESFSTKPNINSRTLTNSSVDWSIDNTGVITIISPNIKRIVGEIISRSGWISGNALTIILKGKNVGSKKYKAQAKEASSGYEAKLYIQYSTEKTLATKFIIGMNI